MDPFKDWLPDLAGNFMSGVLLLAVAPVLRRLLSVLRAGAAAFGCWVIRVGRTCEKRLAEVPPWAVLLVGGWAEYSLGAACLELAGVGSHPALALPLVAPYVILPVAGIALLVRRRFRGRDSGSGDMRC